MTRRRRKTWCLGVFALAIGALLPAHERPLRAAPTPPLHPPVPLLDRDGQSVVRTGGPVSTTKTCGACHDTASIARHSYHAAAGSDERFQPGMDPHMRPWDWSPGTFGRWNPLTYRYLSPAGDERLDLGTAEWIQLFGWRHVGGGPATSGHGSTPLDQRGASGVAATDPDMHVVDAATGRPGAWDWKASGTVEGNCFLCHASNPDNEARVKELQAGRFRWANTATLAASGIVAHTDRGWTYRADAFAADGSVGAARLGLRNPTAANCGQCHGQVHRGDEPLAIDATLRNWSTATEGQVFSAQRMSESAANLVNKERLARPWDVHAARLLECTDCHFSLNNPAESQRTPDARPAHQRFDPRRLSIGEYLARPSHQFAKGHTAQGTVARRLDGTMRGCADCHDAERTHDWLPYRAAHFQRLSCEACHVGRVEAPAVRQVDWTMLTPDGKPLVEWRGVEGAVHDPAALVTGFRPVLLPHRDREGREKLVPYNLVAAWYWVEGGAVPRPVRLVDLKAALLQGDGYHPGVLAALDGDHDGRLSLDERRLDTDEKVDAVRGRLAAVGVKDPHLEAEIQPYGIHHGVGPAGWATRECKTCHQGDSRLGESFAVASYVPGGKMPRLVGDADVTLAGSLRVDGDGALRLDPSTREASLYVLGHDRWPWVNVLGALALMGVLGGVGVHTALRVRAARPRLFGRRSRTTDCQTVLENPDGLPIRPTQPAPELQDPVAAQERSQS